MVKVDVEYCGFCDFHTQCEDLAKVVKMLNPEAEVKCRRGRKGAFEVKIDDVLIYSRLNTSHLPNFNEIAQAVRNAFDGKPVAPLNDGNPCVVM